MGQPWPWNLGSVSNLNTREGGWFSHVKANIAPLLKALVLNWVLTEEVAYSSVLRCSEESGELQPGLW